MERKLRKLLLSCAAFVVGLGCGASNDGAAFVEEADSGSLQETASLDGAEDTDRSIDAPPSDGGDASDSAAGDGVIEDAAEGDTGCTLSFYKDEDGDGTGGTTKVVACVAPAGHVSATGDCRDDNKDVRPGATEYRTVGYANTAPISPTSFDYNCDNIEERDPTKGIAAGVACVLSGLGCAGEGYLPTTAARTGPGVNNHCGSTRFRKCERKTVPPSCTTAEIVAPTPLGCR